MAYRSPISANSFAPTASVARASFPLTLPECLPEERISGASFAHVSLTTARARAPDGERLTARGADPTAVIAGRLSKNKSRQHLTQTQARMGSS